MTQEDKAKRYDEAIERAKKQLDGDKVFDYEDEQIAHDIRTTTYDIFPELKESEDERIRKALIDGFTVMKESKNCGKTFSNHNIPVADILAWLEKQKTSEEALQYLRENHSSSEMSDFQAAMNIAVAKAYDKGYNDGLEKQGRQKPLYIRFGDVPSNETSKIYRGEVEIGDENGVSVYPAFEVNGNIVLGLTLPITKTTLYTQQHLLEYDNRPCYLVSGDYVGKGTDGEPLIRNITIIKRLDNYRIKDFEKQGEQKPAWSEEDEEMYNAIANSLDREKVERVWNTTEEEVDDWLKSIKDKVHPQPKQEWSEEDEKMLNDAIGDVGIADYYTYDDKQEIEKCLKRHSMLAVGKKDFTDIAKHFFELGMSASNKAQKGE